MKPEELLIALLRSEVHNSALPVEQLTPESMDGLCRVASSHTLMHAVGHVLGNAGLLGGDELSKKFKNATIQAYVRHMRMETEYSRICQTLESARISFIPLKGAVIRELYPEPWLRNSCDIDILVKPEVLDQAVAVLEKELGYANRGRGDHDVSLFSPNTVHLELHFDMLEDWYAAGNAKAVLACVWEETIIEDGWLYRCRMPDELFYFYHMAHMAKHFQAGGCGVRPFLDIWVLNHKVSYDREKREALLAKGGLLTFAQRTEKLTEVWFGDEENDAVSQELSDYILRAGIYGDRETMVAVGQIKVGNKASYWVQHRIFAPYSALKAEYPILERNKWLMPIYQVIRWIQKLKAGRLRYLWNDWDTKASIREEKSVKIAKLLKQLDIL